MSSSTLVGCLTVVAIAIAGNFAPLTGAEPGTAMGDLQIAYNRECNAQHSYLHYAEQADKEDYCKIASLMRAAAQGEAVHAASLAAVVVRMGGKPTCEIVPFVIRPVRANLVASIAQESYERDSMYPLFASGARDERMDEARSAFDRLRYAESTHAKLFQEALTSFARTKQSEAFRVCSVCGAVTRASEAGRCIGCGGSGDFLAEVR